MLGGTKDYPCKCHVCGREFTIRSEFLSGTDWYLEDGRVVTMVSCNADNTDATHPVHTGAEVHLAWHNGHPERGCETCRRHGLDRYVTSFDRQIEDDVLFFGANPRGTEYLPIVALKRENEGPALAEARIRRRALKAQELAAAAL